MDHADDGEFAAQMGSYMNTAASSPLRQQFDHFHVVSVRLEGGVLLMGIIALFLTVWQRVSRVSIPAAGGAVAAPTPANR